jgi:hypothetical protein
MDSTRYVEQVPDLLEKRSFPNEEGPIFEQVGNLLHD